MAPISLLEVAQKHFVTPFSSKLEMVQTSADRPPDSEANTRFASESDECDTDVVHIFANTHHAGVAPEC